MIINYFESKNMLLLEESLFTTSFSFRLILFFNIVSFRSLLRFHVFTCSYIIDLYRLKGLIIRIANNGTVLRRSKPLRANLNAYR